MRTYLEIPEAPPATKQHTSTAKQLEKPMKEQTLKEQTLEDSRFLEEFKYLALRDLGHSEYGIPHLARQLGFSQRTLFRRFKTVYGDTPAAYLRTIRMEHAKALLITGRRTTIETVASRVGYEDAAYFARQFQKYFGMKPQQLMRHRTVELATA